MRRPALEHEENKLARFASGGRRAASCAPTIFSPRAACRTGFGRMCIAARRDEARCTLHAGAARPAVRPARPPPGLVPLLLEVVTDQQARSRLRTAACLSENVPWARMRACKAQRIVRASLRQRARVARVGVTVRVDGISQRLPQQAREPADGDAAFERERGVRDERRPLGPRHGRERTKEGSSTRRPRRLYVQRTEAVKLAEAACWPGANQMRSCRTRGRAGGRRESEASNHGLIGVPLRRAGDLRK